ncbi:ABC transporter G family member 20 [Platanthera guangdongensis]|uniref:ABC transporter G family member 20 n=1 Tax=Platanthera guangdongensis TaxID=2320717 RepID=A0ABR2MJX0_9ASPA
MPRTECNFATYRILGLLDRVLFLSRGQPCLAASRIRSPSSLRLRQPIPDNENRTEFALDLIRELESTAAGTKSLVDFHRSWQSTINFPHHLQHFPRQARLRHHRHRRASFPRFANPFWIEIAVLVKRAFTNSRRTPELFGIRIGAVLITGFILATIFWRLDESPKGVKERLGFFAIAMSTMFYTCADAFPSSSRSATSS